MAEESVKAEFFDAPHLATGLRSRVVRGGCWVFALRITDRLFRLARTVVLARLLAPADFGLFGIALLAMSALETFSLTGFNEALIQKKEDTKHYLDMAWTVQAIRGVILALALFLIAPYVASFFNAAAAKPILQVIGLSVLFQGFVNIGVVYFQKELEFHKTFIYQLSGSLADMGVAISAAFLLRSVWALVFGLLAGNFVRMVVSYFVHPYRPRLSFYKQQFKELFGFGKWILGSSILIFLITQGDHIFVGKLLGVTALGFYQVAYRISNMTATEISHVISMVTFPAYSKLQDNLPKLRGAYLKVLQLVAFLSFPIAGLVFVLAPDFIKIFLGQKWMPTVPLIQVLALAGLVRSIAATAGPVFFAVGKPRIDTGLQVIRLAVIAILIYPFTIKWGTLGASVVVLLSIFISNIGFSYMAVKITKCHPKNFSNVIMSPLIGTVVMVLLILRLKTTMGIGIWQFITFACVGVLTYLLMIHLCEKVLKYRMQALIKDSINSLRDV